MAENEVRLTGYSFSIIYDDVEYEISTDVCLEPYIFEGSIEPSPEDNNHTPMEIKDFVEQTFMDGKAIGLD